MDHIYICFCTFTMSTISTYIYTITVSCIRVYIQAWMMLSWPLSAHSTYTLLPCPAQEHGYICVCTVTIHTYCKLLPYPYSESSYRPICCNHSNSCCTLYNRNHSLNFTGLVLYLIQHWLNLYYTDCQITILSWLESQCCSADKCNIQMNKQFTKIKK